MGSDGGIFTFGSAQFYGSTGALHLNRPVVGITPTTDRGGYWLDASDGGIFSFGDAGFYGSIPGLGIAPAGSGTPHSLNAPIVGMVPSADGNGYFMVGADGGVFTFGDAHFEGSCPAIGGCPGGAAVSVIPDSTGNGYWLVTVGGGVTPFGDAPALGSGPGGVVSAARSADGGGYYLLYPNGVVYAFGDAVNYGSAAGEVGGANPAATIFTTADGGGYWIVSSNGSVVTEGDAPYDGGANNLHLNGSIIAGRAGDVVRNAPRRRVDLSARAQGREAGAMGGYARSHVRRVNLGNALIGLLPLLLGLLVVPVLGAASPHLPPPSLSSARPVKSAAMET